MFLKKTILNIACVFTFICGFSQDSTLVKKLLDDAYEYESKNPKKAIETYKKAYKVSSSINYPIGEFKSMMYSGIVKSDMAQYDSALYYYKRALPLSEKANSIRSKAITYVNIGNVFQFKGMLDSVPDYYLKAIHNFDLINDSTGISNIYINLGALFEALNQSDKQIKYLKDAIAIMPKGNPELLGVSYGNLGTAYLNKQENKLALNYFNLSDSISKSGAYPRLRFFSERNLGEYHFHETSYREAIPFYEKAIKAGKAINDEYYKKDLLLNLGLSHHKLNNTTKAKNYLKQALDLGLEAEAIEIQQKATLNLSKIYQSQGDFKTAFNYYETYSKLKDSLFDSSKVKIINNLETKYQSERKDKEIITQKLALEKQESQLQKKQSQYIFMAGLAIALLLTSVLTWFLFQQRQKRKNQEIVTLKREQQVKTLETLMEGEEKERFRIAKELHDGVNVDLSAIKYKLTSLLEKNNQVINEAVAMIDKSCEQVRAISHNLVPPALKDFSLIEALKDYCDTTNNLHKADVSFQYIGTPVAISKKAEINIFRIVQELVNNSIKHAEATEIDVQISHQNNSIQLTIEDNGKGFNIDNKKSSGIGLLNVKSRVDYLNAKLDVTSDSKGTSYVIDINTDKLP